MFAALDVRTWVLVLGTHLIPIFMSFMLFKVHSNQDFTKKSMKDMKIIMGSAAVALG